MCNDYKGVGAGGVSDGRRRTKIGNERGGSHYMGTMADGAIVPFFERKPCDGERLK